MGEKLDKLVKDIVTALKESDRKTSGYDTIAEVKRVDGKTAYVHIPGGIDETPVRMAVSAKKGDQVRVRVSGGKAWLTGNVTEPPTGDGEVSKIRKLATDIYHKVGTLQKKQDEISAVASEAMDRADSAMTSANGKNTIYRASSQPTGGTYANGDVWFDTAHDNKIYRYDGTTWVGFALGDDALDSLSANKLTAGTIDASQITVSNLDAGNITSGKLNANRINTSDFNVGDFTNDGTYSTGNIASVTSRTWSTTYATAIGYVGRTNDAWSGVSAFSGIVGDMVLIPFQITDRDNASASMLCRVRSYTGTTLRADNLALMMDASANKYVTVISGYSGVCVHDAGDASNFANMNSNGFYIYKGGTVNASFETNQAKMGSGKAILKYSEDGSAFGMNNSHRVVLAKATDEGSGVRNDATLSSREISTWDNTKPMAFVNTTHMVNGSTKTAQAGMYAWNGDGTISPIYVILQAGNGSGSSPLTGDAVKGMYVSTPKLVINGADWTSVKGNLDNAIADIADLDTEIDNLANRMQAGSVTFSQTSSGSYSDKTISFSPSYSAAPTVVAGFQLGTGSTAANFGNCSVAVVSVSTTGATLRFYNNSGASKTPAANWIALG